MKDYRKTSNDVDDENNKAEMSSMGIWRKIDNDIMERPASNEMQNIF